MKDSNSFVECLAEPKHRHQYEDSRSRSVELLPYRQFAGILEAIMKNDKPSSLTEIVNLSFYSINTERHDWYNEGASQ